MNAFIQGFLDICEIKNIGNKILDIYQTAVYSVYCQGINMTVTEML